MAVQPLARRNSGAALGTPASNSASMPGFTSIWAISRTMGFSLFPRWLEISQIRRRLVLLGGHQVAVPGDEIDLLVDGDMRVALGAIVLFPRHVLGTAVALDHRPRPGQRIVG